MNVDGPRTPFVAGPPDAIEEPLPGKGAPTVLEERPQEVEFLACKRNAPPGETHVVGGTIDDEIAKLLDLVILVVCIGPFQATDTRIELGGEMGEDDKIVVAAEQWKTCNVPFFHGNQDLRSRIEGRVDPGKHAIEAIEAPPRFDDHETQSCAAIVEVAGIKTERLSTHARAELREYR